jgi:hypothetical protein
MLPALPRLPDVQGLIDEKAYFVLHAPRQSGKTTVIKAAVKKINEEGLYYALYCSLEQLREVTDKTEAMSTFVSNLDEALSNSQVEVLKKIADEGFKAGLNTKSGFDKSPARVFLRVLCTRLDKDLVVFFDEADCLMDQVLLSFLSQLRVGYVERNETPFPRTIALIGMRNIRDYKAKIRPNSESLGSASPFNIITEALTLSNFTKDEIQTLYAQHTEATGQEFLNEALERAWYWSEGQPWLVNALARQVVEKILARNFSQAITAENIDQAADNLMKIRDTHIDSLMARLHESRVKKFIEPMLALSEDSALSLKFGDNLDVLDDDLQYCLDLGLIKDDDGLRPSNPIYASVIVRSLNNNIQRQLSRVISKKLITKWMDGQRLDMTGLLKEFQQFWAVSSEKYLQGLLYLEAGPHLLLTGFLQTVVNGGACVIVEYADGQGYADIVIKYAGRNYVIEVKLKDNHQGPTANLKQLLGYMDGLLVNEGWLVVFDRKSEKSWKEKITWETVITPNGEIIHIVGC